MSTPLHPRVRYKASAGHLLKVLNRVCTIFSNQGFYVPVSVYAEAIEVQWDARRREFKWRNAEAEPPGPWHSISADVNNANMDFHDLRPVVDLLTVLPELYTKAEEARDAMADHIDLMTTDIEAWLADFHGLPVNPDVVKVQR